jgi:putative tricarboxylic transport membrane protein
MVLMGGIQLVQTRSKTKGERKNVSLSLTFYGKSIAQVSALCVLYVFLFERLGYLFSTFLFLVTVLFLFNGKGKWKSVLALAAGFSVGVYVLFGSVLNIQLPRMPVLGL